MPIVNIDNVGAVGLVSDIPARELPPEAWSAVENVRFTEGLAEKSHGEEAAFGTPGIAPHFLIPVRIATVDQWVYANGTAIWKTNGLTHADITRASGAYNGGSYPIWTGGVLGGVLIMNHRGALDYPQQFDSSSGLMKDLANWPADTYARIVRPFKQFAVALDLTDSLGTRYPYTVRWSEPADPGTVPTSWDVTDATKSTGEVPLSETEDILVDCLPLGDINIIYKERTTWAMQFVGGQSVFRFSKLFDNFGMLAPRCAAVTPQGHVVVSRGDIILHNGNESQSIISNKNRKKLFNTLSQEHKEYTFVTVNERYKEVWICYTEEGQTTPHPNRALIWNWQDNSWTFRTLPKVAYAMPGIYPQTVPALTFDDLPETKFNKDTGSFDETTYPVTEDRLLMASADNTQLYMADQTLQFGGLDYYMLLERTGLGIVGRDRQGQWKVDQEAVKFIRNIYPKIETEIDVTMNIYIAEQLKPNDPILWHGPYPFNPETDTKIDCTITTKLIGIRFETTSPEFWRMYGYGIDMDVTARY